MSNISSVFVILVNKDKEEKYATSVTSKLGKKSTKNWNISIPFSPECSG